MDLKEQFPQAEVVGVDFNEHVLETAKRLYGDNGITFKKSSYDSILRDGPYDLIVANSVFCIWPPEDGKDVFFHDFEAAMLSFSVALNPGGTLCLFNSEYSLSQTIAGHYFKSIPSGRQTHAGFVTKRDFSTGMAYKLMFNYEGQRLDYFDLRKVYRGPVRHIQTCGYFDGNDNAPSADLLVNNVLWRRNQQQFLSLVAQRPVAQKERVIRFAEKHAWCCGLFEFKGNEYSLISYWPVKAGFRGFLRRSRLSLSRVGGGGRYLHRKLRNLNVKLPAWADVMQHGPSPLVDDIGKLNIFYTGSAGDTISSLEQASNVGVIRSEDLESWEADPLPLFQHSEFGDACFSISNPCAFRCEDSTYVFLKVSSWAGDPGDKSAIAAKYLLAKYDSALGKFTMVDGVKLGSELGGVEDGHCVYWNGLWYFICVDLRGMHNATGIAKSLSVWVSKDIHNWVPVCGAVPVGKRLDFGGGVSKSAVRVERPCVRWLDRERGLLELYCAVLLGRDDTAYIQGFTFSLPKMERV
jgi:hypothetical protein